MVSLQLMTAPDEDIVPPPIDHDEVIGDETMSPLYEVQYALTLPDPTPRGAEESDPVDIGDGAMDRRPRGEVLLETGLYLPVEDPALELVPKEWSLACICDLDRSCWHLDP